MRTSFAHRCASLSVISVNRCLPFQTITQIAPEPSPHAVDFVLNLYIHLSRFQLLSLSSLLHLISLAKFLNSCLEVFPLFGHGHLILSPQAQRLHNRQQCRLVFWVKWLKCFVGTPVIFVIQSRQTQAKVITDPQSGSCFQTMQAMLFPTHIFSQISLTICNLEPGRFQVEFLGDMITPFKELVVFFEVLTSRYAELNRESFDTP